MHASGQVGCDAVHTQCSDLIDSAQEPSGRVDGKNDGCRGEVTAYVGDMVSSHPWQGCSSKSLDSG